VSIDIPCGSEGATLNVIDLPSTVGIPVVTALFAQKAYEAELYRRFEGLPFTSIVTGAVLLPAGFVAVTV
jgi:hypothetical protein